MDGIAKVFGLRKQNARTATNWNGDGVRAWNSLFNRLSSKFLSDSQAERLECWILSRQVDIQKNSGRRCGLEILCFTGSKMSTVTHEPLFYVPIFF